MDDQFLTLKLELDRFGDSYFVEISHVNPGDDAQVAPVRGLFAFKPEELLAAQGTPNYGGELARQLFAEPAVKEHFVKIETAAQTAESGLRLSLHVNPAAEELQGLRWELLCHPSTGKVLATSERLLFSRFMLSRDFRPVKLRALQSELRAVIAVSAPAGSTRSSQRSHARTSSGPVSLMWRSIPEASSSSSDGSSRVVTGQRPR